MIRTLKLSKRKPRVAGQWEPREKPKRKAKRFVSPSELAEINKSHQNHQNHTVIKIDAMQTNMHRMILVVTIRE